MLKRSIPAIVLVIVLALSAIACGGDDDSAGTLTAAPSATIEGEQVLSPVIVIEGLSFNPSEFAFPASGAATITVENTDTRDHTFTLYLDEEFTEAQGNSITLSEGDSVSISDAFPTPRKYYFRCEFHPTQMQGSFTVQ